MAPGRALAVVLMIAGGGAPALGAEPLELAVRAPDQCADGTTMKAEVLRLARLDLASASAKRLVASVAIETRADGTGTLTLDTDLDGVAGRRVLSGASCRALADAAALTLALALNPEAAPPPAPPPAPTPPTTVAVASRPAAGADSTPLAFLAGAYTGVAAGAQKDVGLDLAIGLGLARGRASAWLYGDFAPPQDAAIEGRPGVGGRLWAAGAAAVACFTAYGDGARLAIAPCLGAEVTRLAGHGTGVTDPRDASIVWTSATAGATAALALGRGVALRLGAFALVPVRRPGVFLDDAGLVHRPAALGGRVRLGIDVAFP